MVFFIVQSSEHCALYTHTFQLVFFVFLAKKVHLRIDLYNIIQSNEIYWPQKQCPFIEHMFFSFNLILFQRAVNNLSCVMQRFLAPLTILLLQNSHWYATHHWFFLKLPMLVSSWSHPPTTIILIYKLQSLSRTYTEETRKHQNSCRVRHLVPCSTLCI